MERDRFSTAPVGKLLTFTEDIGYYDCENFILESAIAKYDGFPNWVAHLGYPNLAFSNNLDHYNMGENFDRIKHHVIDGLTLAGYPAQAGRLSKLTNEIDFDAEIIRQYTDNTGLYHAVNQLLRLGHSGGEIGGEHLAAWILQLNTAIRKLPEIGHTVYRGTSMSSEDIALYKTGQIFIWSSFASYSRSEALCFGGNVLFEMTPVSAIATRDKRAPRDISALSILPWEEEVIMPICSAYRVKNVGENNGTYKITCEILDSY